MTEPGTHACCSFGTSQEREATVLDFLDEGLRRGERLAFFPRSDAPRILDGLRVDIDRLIDSGQLIVGAVEDAYLGSGHLSSEERVNEFATLADESVLLGYPALRVYADNGRVIELMENPGAWLEYELHVARTIPRHQLIGLCGFEAATSRPLSDALLDAVHDVNLSSGDRPSEFHFRGDPDGVLRRAGEVERLGLADLRVLLESVRPLLADSPLSFEDLTFVDGAGAALLHDFAVREHPHVVRIPQQIRRVWDILGLEAIA
jgi:hypothetical protein